MKKLFFFLMFIISSSTLFADSKISDEQQLRNLNLEIAMAEDRGDRKWLENILAPELAFQRANGLVIGKEQFLKDVKPRKSSQTAIESIHLHGNKRAVVTCIVTIEIDGQSVEFHNLRLFIRDGNNWKLLGWANERLVKI